MDPDFSAKLKSARTEAGLTQGEVALAAGLSLASIQKYESGSANPRRSSIAALASAVNKPVTYFQRDWSTDESKEILKRRSQVKWAIDLAQHLKQAGEAPDFKATEWQTKALEWQTKALEWQGKALEWEEKAKRFEWELEQIKTFLRGRYVYRSSLDDLAEEAGYGVSGSYFYHDGEGYHSADDSMVSDSIYEHLAREVVADEDIPEPLRGVLGTHDLVTTKREETERMLAALGFKWEEQVKFVKDDTLYELAMQARIPKVRDDALDLLRQIFKAQHPPVKRKSLKERLGYEGQSDEELQARGIVLRESSHRPPVHVGYYRFEDLIEDPSFAIEGLTASDAQETEAAIAFEDGVVAKVKSGELLALLQGCIKEDRAVTRREVGGLPSAQLLKAPAPKSSNKRKGDPNTSKPRAGFPLQ